MTKTYILRIFRGTPQRQYWEEFELPLIHSENVISGLMGIQKNPINRNGEKVDPVVWEQGCLEEVCGSCSMLINGRPRQACTALINNLIKETGSSTITLAPFTKFPLVKDLIIDRSIMFENLKKIHGWVDVEGTHTEDFGPLITQEKQEVMYAFSTCMTCGCCVEACPQSNAHSDFVGPQIIGQTYLFNTHPIGKNEKEFRNHVMMGKGGISDCGNAQNCAKVCPKNIPLLDAIAATGRDVTKQIFQDLFNLPGRD